MAARIALSTTCKGRTSHLAVTLSKNILDNASYPNVKFFILGYCDGGELQAYLLKNHTSEIESGRLVVYQYFGQAGRYSPASVMFHMAHAKNMVQRLAILEGADLLVTQDADNFTGPSFAWYINDKFQERGIFLCSKVLKSNPHRLARGVAGRVVVRSQEFIKAGGYNEKYDTWRGEDIDLNARLRRMGFPSRVIDNHYLDAIRHGPGMRFKEYPHAKDYETDEEVNLINNSKDTIVNFGNFGCGPAYRNFGTEPTVLKPIPTRIFGIGLHKTATTSLHTAFKILGYDSFHWESGDRARDIWDQMNTNGRSFMLERYYALCDLPIPLLYKKLDTAYPGSKFILTIRNEEEWLNSVARLWDPRYNPTRWEWDVYPFSNRIHRALYGRTDFDRETFLTRYRQHNAEVKEYFKNRPNDLLILDMSEKCDQWYSLCKFLGEPMPSVSYPREYATLHLGQQQAPEVIVSKPSVLSPPISVPTPIPIPTLIEVKRRNWLSTVYSSIIALGICRWIKIKFRNLFKN